MNHLRFLSVLLAAATAAASAPAAEAPTLPPAVESAAHALLEGGTLGDVERTRDGGELLFEVEIVRGASTRTYTLDTEGVPVAIETSDSELPPAVRATLRKELGSDGKLESVARTIDEGLPGYDCRILHGVLARTISLRPDGRVTAREISAAELPPAVKRAANARLANGRLGDCFKSVEGADTYYVITIERPDRPVIFTFGPGGRQWGQEERISFSEAPSAVQQAVMTRLKAREHIRVTRRREEDTVVFEVMALKGASLDVFFVAPSGKITVPTP